MPTETDIMERIRIMQTDTALNGQSIEKLEEGDKLQWQVIEKIKESLTTVKMQISAFGVVNTLILAWIGYKLTKGIP